MEKLKEVLNNALELTPYERGVLIDELSKSEELKRRDKVVDVSLNLAFYLILVISNLRFCRIWNTKICVIRCMVKAL